MRDLLNELNQQFDALESGPSHPADWTAFLEHARAVYERALILRYKSLERVQAEEVADEEVADEAEPPVMIWSPEPPTPEEAAEPVPHPPVEPAESAEPAAPARAPEVAPRPSPQAAPGEGVSLAERLSLQPLKSILPSLGINDRVRFAGALFNGDMQLLQEACAAAEAATDFEGAMHQVQQLAVTGLDWTDEEEAPHQFMQLVQRVHI